MAELRSDQLSPNAKCSKNNGKHDPIRPVIKLHKFMITFLSPSASHHSSSTPKCTHTRVSVYPNTPKSGRVNRTASGRSKRIRRPRSQALRQHQLIQKTATPLKYSVAKYFRSGICFSDVCHSPACWNRRRDLDQIKQIPRHCTAHTSGQFI